MKTNLHHVHVEIKGLRRYGRVQPGILKGSADRSIRPRRDAHVGPPVVTVCPAWTHDPRYQVAPGVEVSGEFSSLGIGRYVEAE